MPSDNLVPFPTRYHRHHHAQALPNYLIPEMWRFHFVNKRIFSDPGVVVTSDTNDVQRCGAHCFNPWIGK
jgi:hypothetical protein